MAKWLKADPSADVAYVEFDNGSAITDFWIEIGVGFDQDALDFWDPDGDSVRVIEPITAALGSAVPTGVAGTGGSGIFWTPRDTDIAVTAATEHVLKYHRSGTDIDLFIDAVQFRDTTTAAAAAQYFRFGITNFSGGPYFAFINYVKIGTTEGGAEIFADDFEDGTLAAWTSTYGDVTVVDDPFGAPEEIRGICWAPTNTSLDVDPTWVRLDDPDGYRLADGFTIVRGRQDVTDKTATGTATVTFRDTNGYLDPTNPSGPWYGQLDPMRQAKIELQNPVTLEWHTLFRGFVADQDHQLDMFTTERGFDRVTWQLVDAFDLFANVILTHGVHGDTPGLATFPNIYYQGTPSNLTAEPDVFVHVDQRIIQLLDDAGWPGTGEAFSTLRNIFSGNVSVQGSIYSRKDSLLAALFDAADAEFPGVANIYISKDGVVTFHGRFARFFPDRPGYGINHWYVGTRADAELDPDVAPLSGPLHFYRSKDDIINASYALPQGVDETDAGVVHASDATSQSTYGYRSENFEVIVSAGHDDLGDPTTAVEEANKFSDYIVGNYKDPKTRVGTLRFRPRSVGKVGATALWRLMTEVEIGDVVTLTTSHAGGGGFPVTDEDFYVEQIRYTAAPAREDMLDITLELEVSPGTFFDYNPFGEVDEGTS